MARRGQVQEKFISLDEFLVIIDENAEAGPGTHILGPRTHILGPRTHIVGPRTHIVGSGMHIVGPRTHIVGPGTHIIGPGTCWTDGPTDRPTDGRTGPLEEMRGRI